MNHSLSTELSLFEVFVNPEAIEVTLNPYLDDAEDGSFENATKVSPAFSLVPMDESQETRYFAADDYQKPVS